MIVFSVKEHVSQCSAVAHYNRDLQHSGLRYIRLWIHTQYLLVEQFIVGLALLMRFVDYKKIEKITCLSFKLATSLNRLIWQHLIKSFSHVTGCKHSCGFLQTSLLCFSVWQAFRLMDLKVMKQYALFYYKCYILPLHSALQREESAATNSDSFSIMFCITIICKHRLKHTHAHTRFSVCGENMHLFKLYSSDAEWSVK